MQLTDQTSDNYGPDDSAASVTKLPQSGVTPPAVSDAAPERLRSVFIWDTRFPSGRVYALAWDVVCHGNSDLSTMLCRNIGGGYFLRLRSGDLPDALPTIMPLSDLQAAEWFDRHPVHFAPRDTRWL